MRDVARCMFITLSGDIIDLGYPIQVPSLGDKIAVNGVAHRVTSIHPSIFGNIDWTINLERATNVTISDISLWIID